MLLVINTLKANSIVSVTKSRNTCGVYQALRVKFSLILKGAHPHDPGQLGFSSKGLLAPVEQKIS